MKIDLSNSSNQAYTLGLAAVGQDVTIWPKAKIVMPGVISIGDAVTIDDFVFIMGGVLTTIGSFVHIGAFSSITGGGEFRMENFSGLSGGVRIYTGNEDYSGSCMTNPTVPAPYRSAIRSFVHIGKHAIIGANAVILSGVVIGEGAVVGANSLVLKNCEPWTINFGSPAKPFKSRSEKKILELEDRLYSELYDMRGQYIPKKMREYSNQNL
jgi:galactoside O-acetyltransferase